MRNAVRKPKAIIRIAGPISRSSLERLYELGYLPVLCPSYQKIKDVLQAK
jgi:hypothetical protein